MHIPVTPSPHSRYCVDVHASGSIDTWTGLLKEASHVAKVVR